MLSPFRSIFLDACTAPSAVPPRWPQALPAPKALGVAAGPTPRASSAARLHWVPSGLRQTRPQLCQRPLQQICQAEVEQDLGPPPGRSREHPPPRLLLLLPAPLPLLLLRACATLPPLRLLVCASSAPRPPPVSASEPAPLSSQPPLPQLPSRWLGGLLLPPPPRGLADRSSGCFGSSGSPSSCCSSEPDCTSLVGKKGCCLCHLPRHRPQAPARSPWQPARWPAGGRGESFPSYFPASAAASPPSTA